MIIRFSLPAVYLPIRQHIAHHQGEILKAIFDLNPFYALFYKKTAMFQHKKPRELGAVFSAQSADCWRLSYFFLMKKLSDTEGGL